MVPTAVKSPVLELMLNTWVPVPASATKRNLPPGSVVPRTGVPASGVVEAAGVRTPVVVLTAYTETSLELPFSTYTKEPPGVATTQAGPVPVGKGLPETLLSAPVERLTIKEYKPPLAVTANRRVPAEFVATEMMPVATESGDPLTALSAPEDPTVYSEMLPAPLLAT